MKDKVNYAEMSYEYLRASGGKLVERLSGESLVAVSRVDGRGIAEIISAATSRHPRVGRKERAA